MHIQTRTRPFHIGLITWNYPPIPTGLGQAANQIACGLLTIGARVTVFTLDRPANETRISGDISVIGAAPAQENGLCILRRYACIGHLAIPLHVRRLIMAYHLNDPFDCLEATNWYAPAACLTQTGVPIVIRNSTPAIDAQTQTASLRDRADLKSAHHLEARTARRADTWISNTVAHGAAMERLYKMPKEMSHTAIDLALPDDLVARGAQALYPDREKPLTLVFVGRAERRKGFDEVLQAFARLYAALKVRPHLILIGLSEGTLTERLSRLGLPHTLATQISDLGRADNEAVFEAYEGCHMVLAPSRYESYGLVYREAAAFGRPLIACREDPSARTLVRETEMGALAQRCTGAAIAEATLSVWALTEKRMLMRKNGLAYARTLSQTQLGQKTMEVYQTAIARRAEPMRNRDYSCA